MANASRASEVKLKFIEAVRSHYATMDRLLFSKSYSDTISEGGSNWGFSGNLPGQEIPREPPRFEFVFPRTGGILAHNVTDISLFLAYPVLFFAAATVAFLRYGVR